jgi:hypothetical protein
VDPATFWTWIAVILQFVAAGAVVIWPTEKWIGLLIMACGFVIATVVGVLYISCNYPDKYSDVKRVFFLFPAGLAVGLILSWFFLDGTQALLGLCRPSTPSDAGSKDVDARIKSTQNDLKWFPLGPKQVILA